MKSQLKDSIKLGFVIASGAGTIFTILGFSMKDVLPLNNMAWYKAVIIRLALFAVVFWGVAISIYIIIGCIYKNTVDLIIRKNNVTIKIGDLFNENAWRIIPVDTHFETRVDNIVISNISLHGQMVLEHGDINSIKKIVADAANCQGIKQDKNGRYTFKLGTAIPYQGKDGYYIMVALTELNEANEARTYRAQYEYTLMTIWKELNRVYAGRDISLPVLGSGLTRFDDDPEDIEKLLRCMICTLNASKVHFNSKISIVINKNKDDKKNLSLYEYKNALKTIN